MISWSSQKYRPFGLNVFCRSKSNRPTDASSIRYFYENLYLLAPTLSQAFYGSKDIEERWLLM